MNIDIIKVIQPGMLSTIQDLGRYGYQRYGVPVSGAMDEFAMRSANLLVGNKQHLAGIEITLVGPHLKFLSPTFIAITGADISPTLNGKSISGWKAVKVEKGDELKFGKRVDGFRSYLTISGGIEVPLVMGSRSTYLKTSIGGLNGRPLSTGDILSTAPPDHDFTGLQLPPGYKSPVYGGRHTIRVIPGPQQDRFDSDAITTLLSSRYTISEQSDRMGYKLKGPRIKHSEKADVISDGNPPGTIQVPGDGNPIILLSDRGTTGGYAKIATVISVDLGRLAQTVPGQSLGFKCVTLPEAHNLLRIQNAALRAISDQKSPPVGIKIEGKFIEVKNKEGDLLTSNIRNEEDHVESKVTATIGNEIFDLALEVQNPS